MSQQSKDNLELGPLDAAIILRADGMLEACMPEFDHDIDEEIPDNIMLGTALIVALQDPEVIELLQKKLAESYLDSEMETVNDD